MTNNDGLRKAREAKAARIIAGEKITFANPTQKASKNPKSLRLAINAKCYNCSNDQKGEVRVCPVKSCPLWPVRPYQGKSQEEDRVQK